MTTEENRGDPRPVVMYTQALCGYCSAARKLLKAKGINFNEIDVTLNVNRRREMRERSGRRTVPQIFVDDEPIGGYDEIATLEREGRLDGILGISG